MKIIIGLGNPGEKYKNTRHNIGFMAVDVLAQRNNLTWKENKKFKAEIAEGADMILVKPLTFMNDSGISASAILRFYNLIPKTLFGIKKDADLSGVLTVIQDELDLNFGTSKLSTNSGSAGHNGVQSIIDHLKTKNFKRLRIGIASDEKKQIPGDKFVLMRFSKEEEAAIPKLLQKFLGEI